jgi:hypothetical protein
VDEERVRELEEKIVYADILGGGDQQPLVLSHQTQGGTAEVPNSPLKRNHSSIKLEDITSSIRIFKKENRKPQ